MQRKHGYTSIRSLTLAAMLTAISIVIGIVCKNFLNFGGGLFRITFENMPIILAGFSFGPIVGGLVGVASDLLSYLLSAQAYPPNLIVTLGAFLVGTLSGIVAHIGKKMPRSPRLILSAALAHLVGSMIVKPIGLFQFYGWMVLWRVPLYLVIAPIEILLLLWLTRHAFYERMLK